MPTHCKAQLLYDKHESVDGKQTVKSIQDNTIFPPTEPLQTRLQRNCVRKYKAKDILTGTILQWNSSHHESRLGVTVCTASASWLYDER